MPQVIVIFFLGAMLGNYAAIQAAPLGESPVQFKNPYSKEQMDAAMEKLIHNPPTPEIGEIAHALRLEYISFSKNLKGATVISAESPSNRPDPSPRIKAKTYSDAKEKVSAPTEPTPKSCLKLNVPLTAQRSESDPGRSTEEERARHATLMKCLTDYENALRLRGTLIQQTKISPSGLSTGPLSENELDTGERLAGAIKKFPPEVPFETPRFQCLNDRIRCLKSGEGKVICAVVLATCVFGK